MRMSFRCVEKRSGKAFVVEKFPMNKVRIQVGFPANSLNNMNTKRNVCCFLRNDRSGSIFRIDFAITKMEQRQVFDANR